WAPGLSAVPDAPEVPGAPDMLDVPGAAAGPAAGEVSEVSGVASTRGSRSGRDWGVGCAFMTGRPCEGERRSRPRSVLQASRSGAAADCSSAGAHSCRVLLADEGEERQGRDAVAPGSGDHLGDRTVQLLGTGGTDDRGAAPSAQRDEALVAKRLVGVEDGVHVDAERISEVTGRGQPLSDLELPRRDLRAEGRGDLVVDRLPRLQVDPDE